MHDDSADSMAILAAQLANEIKTGIGKRKNILIRTAPDNLFEQHPIC